MCPTCKVPVVTPFCPDCGENPLQLHELTLRGLFHQIFEAFTNVDSRLIRSFRYLLLRPGALTAAFLAGQRKPYIGPVALFLIVNVLFFATESFTGGMIFTTPLESHLHTQPWSPLAQDLVASRLQTKQTTLVLYAPVFDQAMTAKAHSLILIMSLFFTFVPAVLFRTPKQPLVAHAVFSLHFYAFFLLLLCVATTIPPINLWFGGAGNASEFLDPIISSCLLTASGVYLYFATGAVYRDRGLARVLKVAVLTVAVGLIVLGYRFALFLITLYST